MEHIVHAPEGRRDSAVVADVADVKFDFPGVLRALRLISVPHVVLLLLVAG